MKTCRISFSLFVILFLILFPFNFTAHALDNAAVTATVTVQNISVSLTTSAGSDTQIAFGTIAPNSLKDTTTNATTGVNDSVTATNQGNINEKLQIKGANSTSWTLGASQGAETFTLKTCVTTCDTSPSWSTALTTSYSDLAASVAPSGTVDFDLQLGAPTSTSTYTSQSIAITVLASTI